MAVLLNVAGEAVGRAANIVPSSSDYTCLFWARVTSTPAGSNFITLAETVELGTDGVGIYTDDTRSDGFYLYVGNGVTFESSDTFPFQTGYLPFAYVRSGNDHRFYCNGILIDTITLDITALTLSNFGVGGGTGTNQNSFDCREYDTALTLAELLLEWKSDVPVRTANLWTDYPLLGDSDDASGNGYDLSWVGSVTFIGTPVSRALVTRTALEIASLPHSSTYNANSTNNDETFILFFTGIVPTGINMLGGFAYNASGSYLPIYSPVTIADVNLFAMVSVRKAVQYPVDEGDRYYIRIAKNSNQATANFSFSLLGFTPQTIPIGSIAVNDDTTGFPLAIIDSTQNQTILNFVHDFPAGEAGDTLTSGVLLVETEIFGTISVRNADYTELASLSLAGLPRIRTCRGANKFYVGRDSNPIVVKTVLENGSYGATTWTLTGGPTNLKGLAASDDESILYYVAGGANKAIKRWDLVDDITLPDLTAGIATYTAYDILVLEDESIVVNYIGDDFSVIAKRYSPGGTTLNTYIIGTHDGSDLGPRMAYSLTNTTSFWLWYQPNRTASFLEIRVSDGTVLREVVTTQYERGIYYPLAATASPTARFGNSISCPFWITQNNSLPPTAAFSGIYKIVPNKRNDTLWVDLNAQTTLVVKIPDPTVKLYLAGS